MKTSLILLFVLSCQQYQYSANGIVSKIVKGKDGYTAYFKSADSITCIATISMIELEHEFKEVKPSSVIRVKGDTFSAKSGDTIWIRVKKLETFK